MSALETLSLIGIIVVNVGVYSLSVFLLLHSTSGLKKKTEWEFVMFGIILLLVGLFLTALILTDKGVIV